MASTDLTPQEQEKAEQKPTIQSTNPEAAPSTIFAAVTRCDWRRLTDYFWPTAPGRSPAEIAKAEERHAAEVAGIGTLNQERAAKALETIDAMLRNEDERRKSVEGRLAGILALTSVATTVVVALTTVLQKDAPWSYSSAVVAFIGMYVATQFLRSVLAAIRGLERGKLDPLTLGASFPLGGEDEAARLKRVAVEKARTHQQEQDFVNDKVTQMAIAQRALLNAVRGMFAGMMIVLAFALSHAILGNDTQGSDILVQRIRGDPEIIKLLRGPEGTQGPVGPSGPSGAQGAMGPTGPAGVCSSCPRPTPDGGGPH